MPKLYKLVLFQHIDQKLFEIESIFSDELEFLEALAQERKSQAEYIAVIMTFNLESAIVIS